MRDVLAAAVAVGALLAACTPKIEVAAEKPIVINLNVKIEHEILVKVDKDLDDLIAEEEDIF